VFAVIAAQAAATSDLMYGILPPGDSGVGFSLKAEPSPYRGADKNSDFLPLIYYDDKYFYLSSYRAGLKLESAGWRTELFVRRRFEGFASNHVPESMVGMDQRAVGSDVGLAVQHAWGSGSAYAEVLTDGSGTSDGSELRLGYRYEGAWNGRLRWRPYATLAFRNAKLNNYYYGVRPEEATADRPAYEPGAGVNLELGLQAAYRLSAHWQLLGGVSVVQMSSAIRGSPVVDDRVIPSASIGLLYDFAPQPASFVDRKPLIWRVLYGGSSECDLFPIITLQCHKVHTQDNTSIAAAEVGQTLVKGLNGWPVDLAGFVGLLRHLEDDQQEDFWQAQAYFKAYYYGFPWNDTVRTRVAFGFGVAYASRVPFGEQRDQALRERDTSKLLLYLDPTIDVNVGDVFRSKSLRDAYFGLGVSHRSGIFGAAQLFNNVDGGSNYIYTYLEWQM
jgi:outer membrane protein